MNSLFKLDTIDEKVDKVLEFCKIYNPPVDIKVICKRLNIDLISEDLSDLELTAERKISGILILKENKKTIYTNKKENLKRQYFTIAHELGHYFLHRHNNEVVSISYRGVYNQEEQEADEFAAKLLMPRNMVLTEYKKVLYPTVSYFSEIFNVSNPAMRKRLSELELDYIDL